MALTIAALQGALGATVCGLDPDNVDQETTQQLRDAWHKHLVLFFPEINLSPAQQTSLAKSFGPRLAATTEAGGDYRGVNSLADEGFPEILVLDTALGLNPKVTANWHTDVTFADQPPIGSLFCMEIPAEGGDTLWSNQYLALERLSAPIRTLISGLTANHGRPPLTGTARHAMIKTHPGTGRECLFVNRGWTNSVVGLSSGESAHLLAMINETAERPELQLRWRWSAGDAALWDNRCTMHYAVNDYGDQRRRARRATIYDS